MDHDSLTRLPAPWEHRHPRFAAWTHIASGTWLLLLTTILYGYRRGRWWRPLLVPAAAAHLVRAHRLLQANPEGVRVTARTATRGSYGIDGGYVAVAVFGLAELGLTGATIRALRRGHRGRAGLGAVAGAAVAGSCASFLYSTGPGKRSLWAEILDELSLRGDEHVLDVGGGRGAILILAAHRLPRGKAVGVDVWRARDQNGNTRAATEPNAVVQGLHRHLVIGLLRGDEPEGGYRV